MPLNLVHTVLQIAFDWRDYHLHAFETVCGEFGSPGHGFDAYPLSPSNSLCGWAGCPAR